MDALDEVRAARAALAYSALCGDHKVLQALAAYGPVEALAHLGERDERIRRPRTQPPDAHHVHLRGSLAAVAGEAARAGARVVIPEDDEWPSVLPDLAATPAGPTGGGTLCLWVRGDLRPSSTLRRAVAVTGARAATAYGTHVAEQFGFDLAGAGWAVVSTGSYGIDGAALRGALSGGGAVVAVLPAGVHRPYPAGHANLFHQIAGSGLLLSPWPPATAPTRAHFAATGRLVATLPSGTVLIEASLRSGALRVLEHAITLGRPAMVVPGPITSAMSTGPHQALRAHRQARLVRSAADVIAELDPPAQSTQ